MAVRSADPPGSASVARFDLLPYIDKAERHARASSGNGWVELMKKPNALIQLIDN